MQNGEENGPLHIKLKFSIGQKASDDLFDTKFLPEPFEDQ